MEENSITGQIVDSAIKVHSTLGCGLLESVYETCLAHELGKRGVTVRKQVTMPVRYDDVLLDTGFRLDLLIEEKVVVEIKAVEHLSRLYAAQLLTYRKLGGYKVGLLLNFNTPRLQNGIRRVVNGL